MTAAPPVVIYGVHLPLLRPALTRASAMSTVHNTALIGACLVDARDAHEYGNCAAVTVGVRILRARPDLRWPAWLPTAIIDVMEADEPQGGTGGRHARAVTRWKADAADYVRYRAVEIIRGAGHPTPRAYSIAEESLSREAIGSNAITGADAIEKAYRRVITRTRTRHPHERQRWQLRYAPRYFPDILTLGVLAAINLTAQ